MSLDSDLLRYRPLVVGLARQMVARVPANIELDDLIQAGMLGLADAWGRFDVGHGVQFGTFATPRIKGAMLDYLRSTDWMPRKARSAYRRIESATQALEHRLGRRPTDGEVAAELGMRLGDYHELVGVERAGQLVPLGDGSEDDSDDSGEGVERRVQEQPDGACPLQRMQDRDRAQALIFAIAQLPPREQRLMRLFYEDGMQQRAIAVELGVHESHINRMHNAIIERLRLRLRAW